VPPPPSDAECRALWQRYHAEVPDDPFVTESRFVGRCQHSERSVLECPERAREELSKLLRQSSDADAGPPEPEVERMILRVGMPSRTGLCVTRARVSFARASGELSALAAEIDAGHLTPDADGVVLASGGWATLPSVGMVETGRTAELGPVGELRVGRTSGGRVWIYVLGALLGRHQNQVGFVYSSAPFVAADFREPAPGDKEICLPRDADAGSDRYLLWCFHVVEQHAADLVEVGAAPD